MILAARIERLYTKDEILELYLNKVYFGDGLYGVEAASRGYFGKHAADLTVAEAALLAGLIKSPSSYAPTVNLERAVARRNVVLQAMVDIGRDRRRRTADRRAAGDARARRTRSRSRRPYGLYFKEQVRRELVERFGWQRVYQGGLRVYTTIDPDLQQAAEKRSSKTACRHREAPRRYEHAPARQDRRRQRRRRAPDPAGGARRDGPANGARARDGRRPRLRREPLQPRRAGEAAAGLGVQAVRLRRGARGGLHAGDGDRPTSNDPIATPQGAWTPEDEHSTADSMTLRTALRTSSNRAAVRLLKTVGIPKAVELRARSSASARAERAVAGARLRRGDAACR